MFNNNIECFINTIPKPNEPLNIDLVLEGGGFNGAYEYGVLLLVKKLEEKGYIHISRISGASIGAALGLCYLTQSLHHYIEYFIEIRETFKKTGLLDKFSCICKTIIDNMDDDTFNIINDGKLYITYFDVKNKNQVVQSTFNDKEDLLNAILRSCYLPIVFDSNITLDSEDASYLDGGQPYIFEDKRKCDKTKILYISINQLNRLHGMITASDNSSQEVMALEGLLDAMEFFTYQKPTLLCSFVNNWHYTDYVYIRFKEALLFMIAYIISIIAYINSLISPLLKSTVLYRIVANITWSLYKDFILLKCFK